MIWLIGCNGMLGTEVARQLQKAKIDFTGTDSVIDITSYSTLEDFSRDKKISAIINCAAYTAVDKAESDEVLAKKLNETGPANIARLAKKIGAIFIHISTDYVFDGNAASPITEDTPISPLGVYGKTKADGEIALQKETDEFYILRTAWLYGWDGKNFVYTMLKAMNSRECVKVVDDQRGSPTFCADLAKVIIALISKEKGSIPYGIYHVTDLGEITWWEFACEIKRQGIEKGILTNKDCIVNKCTTDEYPTPAKRPAYSVLCKDKIMNALGEKLPDWKESLSSFFSSHNFDRSRLL